MKQMFLKKIPALICVLCLFLPYSVSALSYQEIYGNLNTKNFQINTQKLAGFVNVRPRLMLNADKLATIDAARTGKDTYMLKAHYAVQRRATWGIENDPPAMIDPTGYDNFFSYFYEYVPSLALYYLLTGEQQYMDGAVKWLEAACGYPVWENTPDLAVGFGLTTLAYAYDWLHKDLDATLKGKMRSKLVEQARIVYEYMAGKKNSYNRLWVQNHMWIPVAGLACAGVALYGEESEAIDWLTLANNHFSTTASLLPADGFAHEGMDYFFYGMESLFLYFELADTILGIDYYSIDFFQNVGDFILYNFYPQSAWQSDAIYSNIGDASGKSLKNHLLRLAARENQDGYMQWLANALDDDNVSSGHYFYKLLWYDPAVVPVNPQDSKAELKHFTDGGLVVSRTGWNGNENMLIFKSGLPMGKTEQAARDKMSTVYDFGAAHVHPDNNHFILHGNGEILLRDDQYTVPKYTSQHNTLTVADVGQLGGDDRWFDLLEWDAAGGFAQIKKAESQFELDYIVGDAAGSYRAESGVTKFDRHLIFLKPDVLIVVDDIALKQAKNMKLRFWPQSQTITETANGYSVAGANTIMSITDLSGDTKACTTETVWLNTVTEERKSISFTKNAKQWVSVKAITWADSTGVPTAVEMQKNGNSYTFLCNGRTATLNLDTATVTQSGICNISYDVSGQGSYSPAINRLAPNRELDVTFTPKKGWYVASVVVNDIPVIINDHFEFHLNTVITEDTNIEVVFEEIALPPTIQATGKVFTPLGYGGVMFGKINSNDEKARIQEFGFLFSETNLTPTDGAADTVRLKALLPTNEKGQFGIRVFGGGICQGITYFVRPYLVYQHAGTATVAYGETMAFTPPSAQVNAFLQTFGFGSIPFTAYEITE